MNYLTASIRIFKSADISVHTKMDLYDRIVGYTLFNNKIIFIKLARITQIN